MMKKFSFLDLFFISLFFLFAFFIAYSPQFGIIDDHTLTKTLLLDKNIPFFIQPEIGRFYPLDAQEFNILSFIAGCSPQLFYCFNSFCLLIVVFLLFRAFLIFFDFSGIRQSRLSAYLAVLFVITTPAFMTSCLRLFVPERMEFVFLSLFLYSYIALYTKSTKRVWFYSVLCILSSLVALFYKETAFILLGVFAFCHIVFSWWNKKKIFHLDCFILFNCFIWVLCYIFFVILQKEEVGMYGDSPYNHLLLLIRVFAHYFFNDPFLIFCFFPIVLLRGWEILVKKQRLNPLLDSMLIAICVFLSAYCYLGLSDVHYSLPAYIFVMPIFFYYFFVYIKTWIYRISFIFLVFLLLFNYIPMSIQYMVRYKFVPQNFQKTLLFLKEYAKERQLDIYLEGVNRASNVEVYTSFQKWMEFYGIKNFDFFSDIPIDNVLLGKPNPSSPYSVFRSNEIVEKKSGDIVILLPYTSYFIDNRVIQDMMKEYRLLYIADSGINLPLMGIQTILKNMWTKEMIDRKDFSVSQNVYRLPIYFYVFEVK